MVREVFSVDDGASVMGVSLSDHGERLALCGASRKARLYDVDNAAELSHSVSLDRLRTVALSGSGTLLAYGGFDKVVVESV